MSKLLRRHFLQLGGVELLQSSTSSICSIELSQHSALPGIVK